LTQNEILQHFRIGVTLLRLVVFPINAFKVKAWGTRTPLKTEL